MAGEAFPVLTEAEILADRLEAALEVIEPFGEQLAGGDEIPRAANRPAQIAMDAIGEFGEFHRRRSLMLKLEAGRAGARGTRYAERADALAERATAITRVLFR